ncbi:MAG: hypothetical protein ACYDCH_14270 [Gaiellaceae bacterium]
MARRHPLASEALLCAAAAAAVAAVLAWLGPPGTDLAAHAYQRTLFLEHGFTLWNNFWYAGRYSFVTYSILYYPLAALLGIRLLAVATIALAALAFAVVVWREWGPTTRWSSRSFAVVWAGIVLSAAFPFALGMSLALLSIWALQRDARWRFAALAALTLAASPLAFLLLVIVLAGVALSRRISLRKQWVPLAVIATAGLVELLLWRLFPGGGRFPFHTADVLAGAAFCGVGLALTWRVERARVLRYVFAVYLVAMVASYVIPSEVGGNVERLRFAAIPLAVLVLTLRRWRPLPLAIGVLILAVSWNVSPLAASYANGQADVTANAKTWPAAIAFLRSHMDPGYRVEAVDTAAHWPAVYLADAHIPLARGWFRQDDFPQNEILYSKLGERTYLRWLRGLGVSYVVLSTAPTDYSSRAEATLVRSGRAGLTAVFRTRDLTIYAVPNPQPILTGPGSPALLKLSQARIRLSVSRGGTYRLAVRWSPYWRASDGCLRRGNDGMLRLQTRAARTIGLVFQVDAARAFGELAGDLPDCTLR